MTTTLIVRDATLAINGAPEKRTDPRQHLQARIAEVSRMDPRTAEECVEVLSSVAGGDGAEPEVLEALVIVGLAHPQLAERLGLATLSTARRLATRLERLADAERAVAVLELMQQHFPGQESLERDLGQLMRRQGMVQDLVERYFERARKLMREGRNNEAVGWLREVLQLDPGRKDAARLIRDLRFKVKKVGKRSTGALRSFFGAVLFAGLVSLEAMREVRLRGEFLALPQAAPGSVPALQRRLAELERFVKAHPVWHGAFQAVAERAELRIQLELYEDQRRQEVEAQERLAHERLEAADLSRARGLQEVDEGDIPAALEAFRQALGYGGENWAHYAEVRRYVADLEAHLEGKQ